MKHGEGVGSEQRGGKYTERDWYWKDWTVREEGNEVARYSECDRQCRRDGVVRGKGKNRGMGDGGKA